MKPTRIMSRRWRGVAVIAAFLLLASCKTVPDQPVPLSFNLLSQASGLQIANIDRTVNPGADLYQYANGLWLKSFALPADRPSFSVFNSLGEEVFTHVQAIISEILARPDASLDSNERAFRDFYLSYMDEAEAERRGLEPVTGILGRIQAASSPEDIIGLFAFNSGHRLTAPFRLFVEEHPRQSGELVFHVEQSGLGLPNRRYYLEPGPHADEIRAAYRVYIETLFRLAKVTEPTASAARVYALEEKLAAAQWPLEDTRDPLLYLKAFRFSGVEAAQPNLRWGAFFDGLGVAPGAEMVIRQDSYFAELDRLLGEVSAGDWALYLSFHALNDFAPFLSGDFVAAHFAFHKAALQDIAVATPREREAFNIVASAFGDLLGRRYVAEFFDPAVMPAVAAMVENLRRGFSARLQRNSWMSEATKRRAQEKLEKLTFQIGFPEVWKDYGALDLDPRDLVGNLLKVRRFDFASEAAGLGRPRDRREWPSPPITVNAYYNPSTNAIVLPAALIQPPLFQAGADPAANYGALGAIIGHEIIHAFDDQGRKFDGEGTLANWWTAEDEKKFEEEADKLAAMYDSFSPFPGFAINGRLTLGENMGDLGGLSLALEAYRLSLNSRIPPRIAGFSGDERFFISWAQIWAQQIQDGEAKRLLLTSVHAPARYRVNVAAANMPEFHEVFGLAPTDPLYLSPEQRVKIW